MLLRLGSQVFDISTTALVVAPVDASTTAAGEAQRFVDLGADAIEVYGEPGQLGSAVAAVNQMVDVPVLVRDATDGGVEDVVTAPAHSLTKIAALAQAGKAVRLEVGTDDGAAGLIVGAVMAGARLIVTSDVRMARRTITTTAELLKRRGVKSASEPVLGSN